MMLTIASSDSEKNYIKYYVIFFKITPKILLLMSNLCNVACSARVSQCCDKTTVARYAKVIKMIQCIAKCCKMRLPIILCSRCDDDYL